MDCPGFRVPESRRKSEAHPHPHFGLRPCPTGSQDRVCGGILHKPNRLSRVARLAEQERRGAQRGQSSRRFKLGCGAVGRQRTPAPGPKLFFGARGIRGSDEIRGHVRLSRRRLRVHKEGPPGRAGQPENPVSMLEQHVVRGCRIRKMLLECDISYQLTGQQVLRSAENSSLVPFHIDFHYPDRADVERVQPGKLDRNGVPCRFKARNAQVLFVFGGKPRRPSPSRSETPQLPGSQSVQWAETSRRSRSCEVSGLDRCLVQGKYAPSGPAERARTKLMYPMFAPTSSVVSPGSVSLINASVRVKSYNPCVAIARPCLLWNKPRWCSSTGAVRPRHSKA